MESITKVARKEARKRGSEEGRKFLNEHTTVFEKKIRCKREGGREGGRREQY